MPGNELLHFEDFAVGESRDLGRYVVTAKEIKDFAQEFDPQSFHGTRLYVPDVALGRLIETPKQIQDQIDRFSSAHGALDPQTARVTGYDFLADGAQSVFDSLLQIGN